MTRPLHVTITAEEVRAYRERTGAGIVEAKRELTRVRRVELLSYLRSYGSLEEKVEALLDMLEEELSS